MATSSNSSPIFSGEYRHALDEKNRVTIPSCWRNGEADEFFVIVSPTHGCLTAMPAEVFMRIGEESKVNHEPAKHQIFIRQLYAMAKRVTTDKQGRLLLNEEQCKTAGLRSDTLLTGERDRFGIWNPTNWTKFKQVNQSDFEEVAKGFGL